MASDAEPIEADLTTYILPRYLRYARTLALVSSAAVGIAAGAAVFSSSGCSSCSGTPCGRSIPPPFHADASPDVVDSSSDAAAAEAASDAAVDAGDTGGGPRPAPLLPPAWMA